MIWLSRFAEAFAVYAHGVELLGDARDSTRATLLGATAALLGLGGSLEAAEAQFAEALALAEALGDDRALGRILWGRTMSFWSHLRADDAIECGLAAIEHARRAGDLWTLVDALAWTTYPMNYSGRSEEARPLADEGAAIGAKIGHLGGEFLARRGIAGSLIFEEPDLDGIERRARDDLDRLESIRSPWVSMSYAWVAGTRMMHGDLDGALPYAEEAIRLEPASAWAGLGWAAKFLNRARAGERETCRRLLSEARARLPDPGELATAGQVLMLYAAARGCVIVGLVDDAGALYPAVAARIGEVPIADLWDVALASRVAGMAAAAAGMWPEAESHFVGARRQVDEFPNPLDLPHVLHWHASMLLDRGQADDRERAHAMLDEALAEYRRFGMPLHEAAVDQLLASLG